MFGLPSLNTRTAEHRHYGKWCSVYTLFRNLCEMLIHKLESVWDLETAFSRITPFLAGHDLLRTVVLLKTNELN